MTFGTYLRDARKRAGFTLRDLGELLGLSHVFVTEIETGRRRLARARWGEVSRALPGVTLEGLAAAALESALLDGHLVIDPRGASAAEREALLALLVREVRRTDKGSAA